jgi:hypothetical protein
MNGDSPAAFVKEAERSANVTAAMNVTTPESSVFPRVVEPDDDDDNEFTLIDFEMFQDLDWYDEVGEDGKEYRLSEQLADEDWEEEKDDEAEDDAPLTYEEYTERAAEIIEAAQSEILETAEILNAAPGTETLVASGETVGSGVARGPMEPPLKRSDRKEQKQSGPPKYDQTRLDGISQLWGLPPEDPDALEGYPDPVSLDKDDFRFDGISQLWGETPAPLDASSDTTIIDSGGDFGGISQLWGDQALVGMSGDSNPTSTRGTGEDGEPSSLPFNIDTSVYSELEWYDEVGPDGQEYRLSEMLADEEWEDDDPEEAAEPISFEDFAKQVEDLREAARDEKLETEAILKAPPGADSWDDPHYDRRHKEKVETPTNDTEIDDSLDALEMDSEDLSGLGGGVAISATQRYLGNISMAVTETDESPSTEEMVVFELDRSDSGVDDSVVETTAAGSLSDDDEEDVNGAMEEGEDEDGDEEEKDVDMNGEDEGGDAGETDKDQ